MHLATESGAAVKRTENIDPGARRRMHIVEESKHDTRVEDPSLLHAVQDRA